MKLLSHHSRFLLISLAIVCSGNNWLPAAPPVDREGVLFFEAKIRPLLVKHCYACHSRASDPVKGGLRLDTRAGWKKGGDSGPVITPGKASTSRLLKAVLYTDEDLAMPPDAALPVTEINLLREWINRGAPDPRTNEIPKTTTGPINWAAARRYWAFRPLDTSPPPKAQDVSWVRTPIDQFILSRLEQARLVPAPRADRRSLLRRISLDITGLPPTPREQAAFSSDRSPGAWSRVIDRLLASPAYGERWGRHWLDVVRYADDQLKTEYFYRSLPHAWRYRDWVVRAFNEDLPYDQFVLQQIAGDLLDPPHNPDGIVAVGMLGLGLLYQDDGGTPDGVAIARAETLDDRVDTVTRGLLGLTVSCARCHDHKFDPIPTSDYYSLAGIFNNTGYVESAPLVTPQEVKRRQAALDYVTSLRTELEAAEKKGTAARQADLATALAIAVRATPPMPALAHSVKDTGNKDMAIALRGNLRKPGPVVPRRFLQALTPGPPPAFTSGSGRLELGRSIISPTNPLAARVIVNRLWQHHFGRGLVATASNFGSLGARPSHPRLLDWLASRLIAAQWSLKQVHRDILLSATYQLSTKTTPVQLETDADNLLLWRMPLRRLDIEAWRDSILAVAGTLDRRIGGPASSSLLTTSRRTVYGAVRRDNQTASDALLRLFDFPNPRAGSGGRATTTVPQQQLFALNSTFVQSQAHALAQHLRQESRHVDTRLDRVFRLLFARGPTDSERSLAHAFFSTSPAPHDDTGLWSQYCQALLVSNEFLFRP